MSNPLKRRMAKAALVLAAGTAPVVAAGGQAHADVLPTDLGKVTGALDSEAISDTVNDAAQTGNELLETAGREALDTVMPAAAPVLDQAAHDVGQTGGRLVGDVTKTVTAKGKPTTIVSSLPTLGERLDGGLL